jgi:hypothetical protein
MGHIRVSVTPGQSEANALSTFGASSIWREDYMKQIGNVWDVMFWGLKVYDVGWHDNDTRPAASVWAGRNWDRRQVNKLTILLQDVVSILNSHKFFDSYFLHWKYFSELNTLERWQHPLLLLSGYDIPTESQRNLCGMPWAKCQHFLANRSLLRCFKIWSTYRKIIRMVAYGKW